MSPRKRSLGEKLRSLYLWHRYAGLAAALLAIWLAVTGLLLNHADDLQLHESHVENGWLLAAYNIKMPERLQGLPVTGHWLVNAGGRVYLDHLAVAENAHAVGAADTPFGFVIALENSLQLYTHDAVLIEEIPFTAAGRISGITPAENGGVLIEADDSLFLSDAELLEFERIEIADDVNIPEPELETLPDELAERIGRHIVTHALTWERALLDLHSGRLFGTAGKWLADIAGILLLLLAISGVIIWLQRWRYRRQHR